MTRGSAAPLAAINTEQNGVALSIVLPVFNEATLLRASVRKLVRAVEQLPFEKEVIIVEDGSTDGSYSIARELSEENRMTRLLHFPARLGKGGALKRAFKTCRGRVAIFMDIDMAADLRHISEAQSLVDSGFDAVLGSRIAHGSRVGRSFFRRLTSLAYNLIVNMIFHDGILDHQCGFKCFNRKALNLIVQDVADDGFFFDTELIVRLARKRYSLVELPLIWVEPRKSHFHENPASIAIKLLKLARQLNLSGKRTTMR